jgi:hypothetical protein
MLTGTVLVLATSFTGEELQLIPRLSGVAEPVKPGPVTEMQSNVTVTPTDWGGGMTVTGALDDWPAKVDCGGCCIAVTDSDVLPTNSNVSIAVTVIVNAPTFA